MSNIITSPQSGILEFNTGAASGSAFDGSLSGAARLKFESSGVLGLTSLGTGVADKFTIDGSNGRIFSVNDTVTGSIFSVNDAAGLPILEVDSTSGYDKISMGEFGTNALVVSGSGVSFATAPTVNGNPVMTGANPFDEDTLQTVTDRGATTTNAITLQNNLTLSYNYPRINLTDTDNDSDYSIINNDGSFGIYDATNAAYRLQILSGGNVGIGITAPIKKLQVDGSILGKNNGGYLQYDAQGNVATILNLTTANELSIGQASHVDSMSFNVGGGDDRIFINSDGNVGIGDATPIGDLQIGTNVFSGANGVHADSRIGLSVNGSLKSIVYASTYNNASFPDYGMVFIHGPDTGNYNVWSISPDGPAKGSGLNFIYRKDTTNIHTTAPLVYFNGDGAVGIGTTEPAQKFHVAGGNILVDSQYGIRFNDANTRIYTNAETPEDLIVEADQDLHLDPDGVVRVDTAEFQITSSAAFTTHLNYQNLGNNYISQANGGATFFRNSAGTLMSLNSAGTLNVGAAGVTNTRLHVTGAASDSLARFKDGDDGVEITTRGTSRQQIDFLGTNTSAINAKGSLHINYDSNNDGTNDTISFTRNGADEAGTVDMTIREGNVGIGTTDPSYKLEIDGGDLLVNTTNGGYVQVDESDNSVKHSDNVFAKFGTNNDIHIGHNSTASLSIYDHYNHKALFRHLTNDKDIEFQVTSSSSQHSMLLLDASTQKVGIGSATPAYKLDVAGDIQAKDSFVTVGMGASDGYQFHDLGTGWGFKGLSSDARLAVLVQGIESMTYESNGRIGIGVTNPATYKLQVAGEIGVGNYMMMKSSATYMGMIGFNRNGNNGAILNNTAGAFQLQNHNGVLNLECYNSGGVIQSEHAFREDGKVGIGLTNPSHSLSVGTIGNANGKKITTYLGGSNEDYSAIGGQRGQANAYCSSEIRFINEDNSAGKGAIAIAAGTNTLSEHLRVTSAGNVGIGTTDPPHKLSAKGTISRLNSSNIQVVNLQVSTEHGQVAINNSGGTEKVLLNSNGVSYLDGGNVGIGVTDPDEQLEVQGKTHLGSRGQGGGASIEYASFSETNGGAGTLLGNAVYAGTTNNTYRKTRSDAGNFIIMTYNRGIAFHTNVTGNAASTEYSIDNHEQMRITTGGSVGIGTNDPFLPLHVNGDARVQGNLMVGSASASNTPAADLHIKSSSTNARLRIEDSDSSNQYWDFYVNQGDGLHFNEDTDTRVTFKEGGNVGIGNTEPADTLQVGGQVRIDGSTTDGLTITSNAGASQGLLLYNNSSTDTASIINYYDGPLILGQANAEVMRLHDNGNVGIGTNSPAALLSVGGGNSTPSLGGGTKLIVDMTQGAGNYASMSILAGNAGRSSLFFGDSDTEARGAFDYRHADDSLSISTAASEVMRIDGGVRIGSTSKKGIGGNELFTISGGGASIPSQTWTNAHSSALYLRNYNNAAGEWQLQPYNGGNGGVIQLAPYGGNVTIGNLTASAKLDIKTDSNAAIRCESATGGHFIVDHGGKVGIQTHSPQYALHIDNNGNLNPANVLIDSTTTADASISFSHNGTFGYTIGTDESDGKLFKISSGSALGTNDRLTVNGVGLKVEGIVQADSLNTKANDGNIIYRSDSRTFVGNAGNNSLIVLDGGNVGIGTTDPSTLDGAANDLVVGDGAGNHGMTIFAGTSSTSSLYLADGTAGDQAYRGYITYSHAAEKLSLGAGGQTRITATNAGLVGINQTNPTSRLHVYGGDNTGLFGSIRNDHTNRMNMKVAMASTTRYIGTVSQFGNGDSSGFTIRIYDGAEKVFRIVRVVVVNSGGTNVPRATVEGGGEDTDIHINLEYKNRDGDATKTDFFLVPTSKNFTQYVEIEGYILRDTGWNTTSLTSVSLDDDLALNILDTVNGSRVGVGTTDPSAKLHAEGSMIVKGDTGWAGTDNQNGAIFMNTAGRGLLGAFSTSYARPLITANSNYIDLGSAGTSLINGFRFYAGSAGSSATNPAGTIDFYTSGSNNRLHIAKGGGIGIGTDDPTTAKLRIKGTTNDNSALTLQCIDSTEAQTFFVRNDGVVQVTDNYFYVSSNAGAYVQHDLRVRGSLSNDGGALVVGGDVNFDSNTLYVDSTNNRVGVGVSDPDHALDVVGTYRIASNATNSTNKLSRMLGRHYTNAEEDVNIFSVNCTSTTNALSFGGGSSDFNTATNIYFYTAANNTSTYAAGQERMRITSAGNIGIGVSSDPSSKLHVDGELTATTKTFDIEHPTQSGKRLIHGCFEGPEHGVYFRGKTQDSGIQAPEYWSGLVDIDSMTVDVTPIGPNQSIYVDRVEDNGDVYVGANTEVPLNYFYIVYGERKDIDNLVTVKDAPVASPSDHID